MRPSLTHLLLSSQAEAALTIAAKDAKTFAEAAATLRVERDALESRCEALAAEVDAIQAALNSSEGSTATMRSQVRERGPLPLAISPL